MDFLIIDEIQDLLTEPYLDVLDLMVKGGLGSGGSCSSGTSSVRRSTTRAMGANCFAHGCLTCRRASSS